MNGNVEVKLKSSKTKVKIKEGMMLYYPSYGPGKITAIEEKECLGEKILFCQLDFEKDDLKISIPVNKMDDMGIRTIISKENAKKILDNVLNKHAKSAKGIWTKRIQEYETKLNSGNSIFIAEVVRDLVAGMKDPNKSYGERVIYEKAFNMLVSEFAIALNCTMEETNKQILDVLNANYKKSNIEIAIDKQDDMDGDFDDDDIDDIESDKDYDESSVA